MATAGLIAALVAALTPGSAASARDRRWQQDIAYLARELPRVRIDGLGSIRKAAWEAAAARLSARVPRLSNGQLTVGLFRIVAMIHDDETAFDLPASRFYPLGVHWLGGHLYVLGVLSGDRDLLGAELVSIDRHPIGAVLSDLQPEIDYQDAGVLRYQEAQLVSDASLLYWLGVTRSPLSAAFTVRTVAGRLETVQLAARPVLASPGETHPPVVTVPLPLYERDSASPYWLLILRADHAVYLRYNECLDDGGFQRLAARALALLRRYPSYRLIVDLRGNGGGDTSPFESLINGIRSDPAVNKRGRIFGLIDPGTDSAATVDAYDLGRQTHAILMGQQVEDPIDEFGNDNFSFRLPHSGLTLQYTTKIVHPALTTYGTPDVVVAPTLRQVLAGTDPVLQRALSYGS